MNLHFALSWALEVFERDGKHLAATAAVLTLTYLWAFSLCTGGKQRLRISSFNCHHSDHLSSWLLHSPACSQRLISLFFSSPWLWPKQVSVNRPVLRRGSCSVPHVRGLFSTSKNKCQTERDVHLAAVTWGTCDRPTSAFWTEKKTINMVVSHHHSFFSFLHYKMMILLASMGERMRLLWVHNQTNLLGPSPEASTQIHFGKKLWRQRQISINSICIGCSLWTSEVLCCHLVHLLNTLQQFSRTKPKSFTWHF